MTKAPSKKSAGWIREVKRYLADGTGGYRFAAERIVKVMKDEKNIDPNVDFFSATVYYSMGIETDLYTCIFAMARISGWTAHYIEQLRNNRLIRPKALYLGEKNLPWTPIENR